MQQTDSYIHPFSRSRHSAFSPICLQGVNQVSSSKAVSGQNFLAKRTHVSGITNCDLQKGDSAAPVGPQYISDDMLSFKLFDALPEAEKNVLAA
jgi:hypothetical protein